MLSLEFKGDRELNEEERKTKVKVWKDVNEVIKASIISEELEEYYILMCDVPRGEKPKY